MIIKAIGVTYKLVDRIHNKARFFFIKGTELVKAELPKYGALVRPAVFVEWI